MNFQTNLRTAIMSITDDQSKQLYQDLIDTGQLKNGYFEEQSGVTKNCVLLPSQIRYGLISYINNYKLDLSTEQIKALAYEIEKICKTEINLMPAEEILSNYQKVGEKRVSITMPCGIDIQEAGVILNAAAKDRGMKRQVLNLGGEDKWAKVQADPKLLAVAGQEYSFDIPLLAVDHSEKKYPNYYLAPEVPLAAIALAEACELLISNGSSSLLNNQDLNERISVHIKASGYELYTPQGSGVSLMNIAIAASLIGLR